MVRGGLSSVSYRNARPKTIIELARAAGLGGIEWSADTHAPHGDLKRADELLMATLRAGLTVTSYGSFYRLCGGADPESGFSAVLDSARRLQAATIRIWAPFERGISVETVAAEGRSIADKTGKLGITVCLEPHERSAVHDYRTLLDAVLLAGHPFFKACWTQLPAGCSPGVQQEAARELAPHLALAHIRNWTSGYDRMPLAASEACWTAVEGMGTYHRDSVLDCWAVLEYLADESPETLKREADALAERIKAP